jgi:hypothetical protein
VEDITDFTAGRLDTLGGLAPGTNESSGCFIEPWDDPKEPDDTAHGKDSR